MHTLFNIVTTLLLLSFGQYLTKLAEKIMPDSPEDLAKEESILSFTQDEFMRNNLQLGFSAVYLKQLGEEISKMLHLAKENVDLCFEAVINKDMKATEKAHEREETIDLMKKICVK